MKIFDLDDLAAILRKHQQEGKRVVHCHGVFDLLHLGHIRYLRQARKKGDILVVTVTQDKYVDKGPHRPAFSEDLRAEAIASLDCVDYVAVNKWPTAVETLRHLRPNFYVKGSEFKDVSSDMTGKIGQEAEVVQEIGAELIFTDDVVFSSSNLINRYLSTFPEETQEYLALFRDRYKIDDVLRIFDEMEPLKVLLVGDTILDEYQYCNAIGISSKDPTLVLKYQERDLFAGGVLAIANHLGNFANSIQVVSLLGEFDRQEKFIRSKLSGNVSPFFVTQPNAPTTLKRRFVDGYSFNKLFEVYVMDDSGLPDDDDLQLCEWLKEEMPKYDLVMAADFGHGAISERMVEVLEEHAPFLAVNTQANAGNRGFHTINRYRRADFVCLAAHEIRLASRKKNANERLLAEMVAKRMGCKKLVVTLGRRGSLVWESDNIVEVPAFAQDVVDRIGAGDTFFSITSLAAVNNVPPEVLGFIGNVVGAEAVRTIGNQKPIERLSVKKHITSLMK